MPIYEYACEKCGDEFEVEQRITDDPVKSCPSCRSRKVKKLISQTSFVLKGGGWYSDLYSGGDGKKKDKEDSSRTSEGKTDKSGSSDSSSSDSSSSDSSSSDSKSDKSDSKPAKSESPGKSGKGSRSKASRADASRSAR